MPLSCRPLKAGDVAVAEAAVAFVVRDGGRFSASVCHGCAGMLPPVSVTRNNTRTFAAPQPCSTCHFAVYCQVHQRAHPPSWYTSGSHDQGPSRSSRPGSPRWQALSECLHCYHCFMRVYSLHNMYVQQYAYTVLCTYLRRERGKKHWMCPSVCRLFLGPLFFGALFLGAA